MTMARLNEGCSTVPAFTLRYRAIPSESEVARFEELAKRQGGAVTWQQHPAFGRAYALIEGVDAPFAPELEPVFIALAVTCSVPEALPKLEEAFAGTGRPLGMRSCERAGDAIVLEWDLEQTSARVVLDLIDVELARFRATRTGVLLTPIPLAWWTRIAAEGLEAPEIAPNRVLEALIEGAHVPH
jgi:hypothetical protein